ncbi:MAG: hypothetical protein LBE56_12280 [Tannerella sp.]|jgi:hypothetical protein|nr:hypothetical protein [Tannerella sp.]
MTRKQKIREYLENCSDSTLMEIYTGYCNQTDTELTVFDNDEDFYSEIYRNREQELARAIWASGNTYNFTDNYIGITAYANFTTSNDLRFLIDIDTITDYATDNPSFIEPFNSKLK